VAEVQMAARHGSYGTFSRCEEESMWCPSSYRGRRRETPQRRRTPLSPFALRRYGTVCGGFAARRCFWLACLTPQSIRACSAGNATTSTTTMGC
jgi:hypothetical protein